MADWNSLRPLKNHKRIMVFIVVVLGAVLFLTPRHAFRAQSNNTSIDNNGILAKVNAVGGLSIRNEPNINSIVLTTAPYHATLTIIDENAGTDNIKGRTGNWYKVNYQEVIGYAWGNYIER